MTANPCQPSACGSCPLLGACGAPLEEPELRTPNKWAAEYGFRIMDPDGWREPGAPAFGTPITHEEFSRRVAVSTVSMFRAVVSGADERPDVDPAEPRPDDAGCCGGGCK